MANSERKDVLIGELRDLLDAEYEVLKDLPHLIDDPADGELHPALQDKVGETGGQVARFKRWLGELGKAARGKHAMERLLSTRLPIFSRRVPAGRFGESHGAPHATTAKQSSRRPARKIDLPKHQGIANRLGANITHD